ncbi:MAG: helix-turn-helix domain-containing protein [Sphingomicrobium sp.]
MRDGDTDLHAVNGFSAAGPISMRADPFVLRQLPVFDGLDDDLAHKLIRSCSARQYRAGAFVVRAGEPLDGLHIVGRGIIDLTHVDGEDECGVLLLSAKDLLLPATTLFREPALVSARALTTAKVIVIDGAVTQEAMNSSTVFAINAMKAVSGQWRMAVRNILDLNCRSAAQRLGAFLLRIADLQPGAGAAVLPIPKRHLAVRLGMTAETLSRMLQVVANHGLYLRGRTIIIRDRSAIEEFCGPDPYPEKDERVLDVFAL